LGIIYPKKDQSGADKCKSAGVDRRRFDLNTIPMSKIKILHVVGRMNRGGIETWLMHILRALNPENYCMDFLVHTRELCAYDDEIRQLGSHIIPCSISPWSPLYFRRLKQIFKEYGPYEIVHSHLHHFSGYILKIAHQSGVAERIAHSHNDTRFTQTNAGLVRRLYLAGMKRLIRRHATTGLAVSRDAAEDLFGLNWTKDPRWMVLSCGIDLTPFHDKADKNILRKELAIPPDAFVIGHVGRFSEQKNHEFIVEIIDEVIKRDPDVRFILIGEGSLRRPIQRMVSLKGLTDRVIFSGARSDIPRIMLKVMDLFLFPSLYEGLGIVGIEAQAAGLPLVLSDTIPGEIEVIKPLVHRLSLSQPAADWAKAILNIRNKKADIPQSDAVALIENSQFNISTAAFELKKVYNRRQHGQYCND